MLWVEDGILLLFLTNWLVRVTQAEKTKVIFKIKWSCCINTTGELQSNAQRLDPIFSETWFALLGGPGRPQSMSQGVCTGVIRQTESTICYWGTGGHLWLRFFFFSLHVISETIKDDSESEGEKKVLKPLQLFVRNFWSHFKLLRCFGSRMWDMKNKAKNVPL